MQTILNFDKCITFQRFPIKTFATLLNKIDPLRQQVTPQAAILTNIINAKTILCD